MKYSIILFKNIFFFIFFFNFNLIFFKENDNKVDNVDDLIEKSEIQSNPTKFLSKKLKGQIFEFEASSSISQRDNHEFWQINNISSISAPNLE